MSGINSMRAALNAAPGAAAFAGAGGEQHTASSLAAGAARNISMMHDVVFMNFSRFLSGIRVGLGAQQDMACIMPHAKGRCD